ncbi:MAG: isoprenoid biosynthesis glyoxalase ElbB [Limisphaerales bacterium]|jgi:enhancing lycopene biosynthesis protein 2|nr:isoprenoid biosynthesis glyoxalase ElbB [Verrucomicrobiota bacterium]
MKKKVLVVLAGCGVRDGSEIQESVVTLLALDRAGVEAVCAAPNITSSQCVDHFRGTVTQESRNVLTESARIARGEIVPLGQIKPAEIDAVVLPGGLGVATNLSNFHTAKEEATVEPTLKNLLLTVQAAGKPLGFLCLAPVIAAILFGAQGLRYTIGDDEELAAKLARYGAQHVNCAPTDAVTDAKLKIVTTPAFMLAERLSELETGVDKLVSELLKLA